MSLIVDLGPELEIEKLTAEDVFHLYHMRSSPSSPYSKHANSLLAQFVRVVPKHTYAVLLNKREIRDLFVFTVVNHLPNQNVDLKYAIKDYQIMDVKAESPGFKWDQKNTMAQTDSSAGSVKKN